MNEKIPKVGLGVIVLDKTGKVLLILRNSDAKKADSEMRLEGTWTLPAGKMKYGETLFVAAKRKVKEETNLDVSNLEVISVADDINNFAHYVTIGLVADSYEGEVSLGDTEEHVDYRFFDMDKMPPNLCEPSMKIIRNYRQNKIYNGKEN